MAHPPHVTRAGTRRRSYWPSQLGIALLTMALLLISLSVFTSYASSGEPRPGRGAVAPAQVFEGGILGEYRGLVTLYGAAVGVYSDTLATATPIPTATPPPVGPTATPAPPTSNGAFDLPFDLGLYLQQSGATVTGYVVLDYTVVFSREHTILATPVGPPTGPGTPGPAAQPLAIGPTVRGTINGMTLRLESEPIRLTLSNARQLADGRVIPQREVIRQFSLTIPDVTISDSLVGEYRETIWGYGLEPVTVMGPFILNRPVFATPGPTDTPSPTRTATVPVVATTPPTDTATPEPTNTPEPTYTATVVATAGPTNTATPQPPTGTPQPTLTATVSVTAAPSSTATPQPPTGTLQPTLTATVSVTAAPSSTASAPPTGTPTRTPTLAATASPTRTATPTRTVTPTRTATPVPSGFRLFLPHVERNVGRP